MADWTDWSHVLRDVGMDLPGWIVFMRDLFGDRMKEKMKERVNADYRGEVMTVIAEMTGRAEAKVKSSAAVLIERLKVAKATAVPDIEDNVMYALGHVIPYGANDKMELEQAIRIFTAIGGWSPDDFAVFVAGMMDEWINQHVGPLVRKFGVDPLMWSVGFISVAGQAAFRATLEKLMKQAKKEARRAKPKLKKARKRLQDEIAAEQKFFSRAYWKGLFSSDFRI